MSTINPAERFNQQSLIFEQDKRTLRACYLTKRAAIITVVALTALFVISPFYAGLAGVVTISFAAREIYKLATNYEEFLNELAIARKTEEEYDDTSQPALPKPLELSNDELIEKITKGTLLMSRIFRWVNFPLNSLVPEYAAPPESS